VEQVDAAALDELRLGHRRRDAQDRLVGKKIVPSGMASTSPVNLRPASVSMNSGVNGRSLPARRASSSGEAHRLQVLEHSGQAPPRRESGAIAGKSRTKNSNTAVPRIP
jgi:hypothetical protein